MGLFPAVPDVGLSCRGKSRLCYLRLVGSSSGSTSVRYPLRQRTQRSFPATSDDKELAAGTSGSTVDLFNVSALQPDVPRDPSQQFQADGRVFPLPVLDDKGLAADTIVALWISATYQPCSQMDPEILSSNFKQVVTSDPQLSGMIRDLQLALLAVWISPTYQPCSQMDPKILSSNFEQMTRLFP
jgi:hypothetical protein